MMWSPERAEQASSLWKAGMSAGIIADQMGDVTRNAVIGKIKRMGLSKEDRPPNTHIRKRPPTPPKREPRPKVLKVKPPFVWSPEDPELATNPNKLHEFDAAIPMEQRKQVWELTGKTCRFPVGVPGAADFFFCGGDILDGYIYCSVHAGRCFRPSDPINMAGIG